ncbi:MAG TPA: hypothetical protein VMP08_02005 [Anaerolineae bacterium]|nr:hypothetical protein [Anaerolineae bacterium]
MPRIRCNYEGCIHLEGNFCTAGEIELDQELGCLTFSQVEEEEEIAGVEEEIEEIEDEEAWEGEDLEEEEEELEDWEEDEDEDWEEDDDDDDEEEDGWSSSKSRRRR